MNLPGRLVFFLLFVVFICGTLPCQAQFGNEIVWNNKGDSCYISGPDGIKAHSLVSGQDVLVASAAQLTLPGKSGPLQVRKLYLSADEKKILIYTNTKKVWRYDTRGDYWVYDVAAHSLVQLGRDLAPASLMFAKFSPTGDRVAYVSGHNLYVEALAGGQVKQLTFDGSRTLINGTFDWVYEEEFDCRDGFRWSPDGKKIAYWQIDAQRTRDYLMLNTTDSVYSRVIPVEYPVSGEPPSPFRIGVADIATAQTKWMDIPTDPVLQSYIPRMEWAGNSEEVIVQHLDRKQQQSDLLLCSALSGSSKIIYTEKDPAWIDAISQWDEDYKMGGWDWLNNGREFLWASEKDGWRHLYKISRDGKKKLLITAGNYDVMKIDRIDAQNGFVYFTASPENATQAYLYKAPLDGKGKPVRITPANQPGTHDYFISPNSKFAFHSFSNYFTPYADEWISLPDHKGLNGSNKVEDAVAHAVRSQSNIEFFKVKTTDGVEMDGWMAKPKDFDSTKKYPVLFYVYTEPAAQTVQDRYQIDYNFLYQGDLAADGYIYVSVDNRGTPAPKGRAWRKAISHQCGRINIHDQAMAATEILKWRFVDTSRVAVWGWSGGGSATLNLMFQYPDIYKTGIAIAAVGNLRTYDNIYQERYMGLPQESADDFVQGSPITYAKNLRGNLLYIHGTGDDNVHYNNAEMLLNELIKYNRRFQFMSYPNRTHEIDEGPGTSLHLATLYTDYLRGHCPPGGR